MATSGWKDVTQADLTRRELARRGATLPHKARSKYGAVKTTVDGIVFDSAKEARRYQELKLLEMAGKIHALTLQPQFVLTAGVKGLSVGAYRADFLYCECRRGAKCERTLLVVEDVKGFKTPLYRWKKKHVEAQYGIQIREV